MKASDFLDAGLLKGPHHQVGDAVGTDGAFNSYAIASHFGEFTAPSTSIAVVRIHEIGALVSLQDVNKALVAAGAAGDALVGMGGGALHVVKHPVDTAKG